MGMTPQHFHTIPTSCAILLPVTQICFVCLWKGWGRHAVGWLVLGVHVDVHGEWVYSWDPVGCVCLHAVHFKELLKYTGEIDFTSHMKLDMYTKMLFLVFVFWNSSIQHRHHKHHVEATKHQSCHLINLNSYVGNILLTCCTLQRAIRTHGEISFTNCLLLLLLLSCDHTASTVVRQSCNAHHLYRRTGFNCVV